MMATTTPDLYGTLLVQADEWQRSAAARRAETPIDPVADVLDRCSEQLRARVRMLESDLAYLTTSGYARLVGVTAQTVRTWCQRGRLPGALRSGHDWRIPRTTPPPAGRVVLGRL